jgi:AcrR family transcriptional regulator
MSFNRWRVLVPRTEVANERVRRDARARILAGARTVFARKGPAATMADVAASAGVSQGLPYRYFRDKDDLVRALVTEAVQQADAEGSPLASPGSAAERLRRLVTSLVEARRAQPELFLMFQHVVSDPATPRDLLELIQSRGRAVAEVMRQLVTEAQAAGEVAADDPDQLVIAVMACLDGLGRFTVTSPAQATGHFPAAQIITRMLEPQPRGGEPQEHARSR